MLSLIGAGKGMYPAPAHMSRYYARPDVTYVPIVDAPPLEWALTWRRTDETHRIREFDRAARDLVASSTDVERRFGLIDTATSSG